MDTKAWGDDDTLFIRAVGTAACRAYKGAPYPACGKPKE